jgi:ATP-dependent DNA helicase RecG
MRSAIDRGERAYVVSPRIVEAEDEIRSAEELHREVAEWFPDADVGLLHGELDAAAKASAMSRFATGQTAVLVATTVIEVGVDVPEATLMVVEHADRFGLAQLHQLRGRVGRGRQAGSCLLVAPADRSAGAESRLMALCATTDGFLLAEQDLQLRGPGEVLGHRQSGAFGLRIGDPFDHPDWLQEARDIAARLATAEDEESESYRLELRRTWQRRLQLGRAG